MQTLFGRDVFDSGGRTYRWEDVLAAASLRGDWASLEAVVREGIACSKWAEDADELVDDEEVETAANDFRYARNLLTSEEIEGWLAEWGLDVDGWMDSVQRRLLREREQDRLSEIVSEYEVTPEEIQEQILYEGICSGYLSRWAEELASRAAASEALPADAELDDAETTSSAVVDIEGCSGLSSHVTPETLNLLAKLDQRYERYCQQVLTPEALAAQVALHRLDWIQFHCDSAVFEDEQMAREAVLCMRTDGQRLDDVAALAQTEASEVRFCLEDVEADWRSALLGASKGDIIGPLLAGEQATVFVVRDKILPTVKEADIQQRAERTALRGALERELRKHVQWRVRL